MAKRANRPGDSSAGRKPNRTTKNLNAWVKAEVAEIARKDAGVDGVSRHVTRLILNSHGLQEKAILKEIRMTFKAVIAAAGDQAEIERLVELETNVRTIIVRASLLAKPEDRGVGADATDTALVSYRVLKALNRAIAEGAPQAEIERLQAFRAEIHRMLRGSLKKTYYDILDARNSDPSADEIEAGEVGRKARIRAKFSS